MAGPDPTGAFNPDEFRANIRMVMLMGFPEDEALRPTFHFASTVENPSSDPGNRPWDLQSPVEASNAPDPILVLCGIDVDPGQRGYTAVGKFEASTCTLSFFEDEWALVGASVEDGGFTHVMIGGKKYQRGATLEPAGLFEVTTQYVEVIAEDL